MTSASAIRDALRELAEQVLPGQGELPEGDLAEHLDSLDRLALVVAIEDRFEIAFDEEDDERVHTADDLVALVGRKLREGHGA